MIFNIRNIAQAKANRLKRGYAVYADTTHVLEFIENYVKEEGMHVHRDRTDMGCWFIPIKE
jgi:hypothetical protein